MRRFQAVAKRMKLFERAIAEILMSAELILLRVLLFLGLLWGLWQWAALFLN